MAYDLVELRIDKKAAVVPGDDVYSHSYVLVLEILVHILTDRTLDQHMDWEVALERSVERSLKNHAGSLDKCLVSNQRERKDAGEVELVVVGMVVLIVVERVVVDMTFVHLSMFEERKVLVIANMVIDDAMAVMKLILVKHRDSVLVHHC